MVSDQPKLDEGLKSVCGADSQELVVRLCTGGKGSVSGSTSCNLKACVLKDVMRKPRKVINALTALGCRSAHDRYRFFDETLITKRVWDTMMQQHGNRPPHNEEDCDAAPDDEEGSASGRLSGKRKRDHDGKEASANAGTGYASASRLAVGSSSTDTSGTTMQPAWMLNWQQLGGRVRPPSQTMAGTEIVPPSPLRVVVWPRSAPNSVPRRRLHDLAVEALDSIVALAPATGGCTE